MSDHLRHNAGHHLQRRLFGDTRDANPVPAPTENDVLYAAAERDLATGRYAHFDPAGLPLVLHTHGSAAAGATMDEVDIDFLAKVDAARAAPGAKLLVVIRLPNRTSTRLLAVTELDALRAAITDRIEATLGHSWRAEVGGRGHDLIVLVNERHHSAGFRRWLSRFGDAMAEPVPLGERYALIRPHLALASVEPQRSGGANAAIRTARAGLPAPPMLTWETPGMMGEEEPGNIADRAALLTRARAALAAGRFVMLYRDIQSLDKPGVAGAHAVPAWIDTDGTEHTFAELDDLAGATGLTHEVIDHMLPALCRDLALWRTSRRHTTPHVLLDLPEQILRDRYLDDRLAATLHAGPVPPSQLVLGIPAAAFASVIGIDEHLHRLGDIGVHLALTAYGDIHTPLAVLTRHRWKFAVIPADVLAKLDDRDLDRVDAERAIVKALVNTARDLKVHLIADDTALPVARRHLLLGLHIPPRPPITAYELAEHHWIALPDFPPDEPDPINIAVPGERTSRILPIQHAPR
ncbi:EAL domain-containing protein [Amycolatopsis sp. cmx-4-83]|uniref:EAL domain-containing protein n=1 Tax=Amycolatopsis sp. cmx-4-83 TaxID=2790940 RepID=UPI003979303F